MKNLLIVFFLFALCQTNTLPVNAQHINNYSQIHHMRPSKNNKEKIRLETKSERRLALSPPQILLFKDNNRLESDIISDGEDITVQIADNNNQIVYEAIISQFQQEWQLDINFLQSSNRYQIRFITYNGGYLFGYFYK